MKVMKWERWGWKEVNEKEAVKKRQRKEGSWGGGRERGWWREKKWRVERRR